MRDTPEVIGGDPPASPEPSGGDGKGEVAGASINTFLIADVRGYTRFTQLWGDEAAAKLAARFAAIAREGVEARGGSVIELRGDEALAVFASARQAIRAALDLQALFAHESEAVPTLPLHVGIGLDAGEAVPIEAGYRGGALNLAARLCGRAEAGEVLASREVAHLARKIDGVRYEDRGPIQLRGLTEPVTVIRVVSEDSDTAARLAQLAPAPPPGGTPSAPGVRRRPSWWRRTLVGAGALAIVATAILVVIRLGSGTSGHVTGCQLSIGPLNDGSFNEAVYEGLTRAGTDLEISVRAHEANSPEEDASALRRFIAQNCSLIVTLPTAQEPLVAAAKSNPTQDFLILDPFEAPSLPNILGVAFDVDQAAFLAGYLAAGTTKTGKVATFGGVPVPTVFPYMDGFAAGVLKYNVDHGTAVQLLGWDPAEGTGSFISQSDFAAFGNASRAREIAEGFISRGADIIFPVAGPAGQGAATAARNSGGVLLIGVDFDAFFESPTFADLWLTSVRKRYDVAVEDVMGLVVNGRFEGGGLLQGTLANGSVDLAPYHELSPRIKMEMRNRLDQLRAGIEDGSVSVNPRDYLAG
jgi:basic membrane protein A